MSRYRTIDLLDKRLVCRDEKFMSANEIVEELQDLEQRLAEAEELKADFKKAMKLFEDTGLDNLLWELLDTITKGE